MDPNATLNDIRKTVKAITDAHDRDECCPTDAIRLAELVEALDNWIVNGGFLPDAWANLSQEIRKALAK
jgi:hypothetical protein